MGFLGGPSFIPLRLGVLAPVAPIHRFRPWRRVRSSWQEMSDSSGADRLVTLWFAQLNQKYQAVLTWCWDFQSRFPTSCRQSLGKEEDIRAMHREPRRSWWGGCLIVSESVPIVNVIMACWNPCYNAEWRAAAAVWKKFSVQTCTGINFVASPFLPVSLPGEYPVVTFNPQVEKNPKYWSVSEVAVIRFPFALIDCGTMNVR